MYYATCMKPYRMIGSFCLLTILYKLQKVKGKTESCFSSSLLPFYFYPSPYFSAPRPVLARTVNSANLSSACGSRPTSVPTTAPRKPSGMLTMPGFSSGKSGLLWIR